jgi:large subunit ribosomal protein L24
MRIKKGSLYSSKKIRKGDLVVAIAGNYRGMSGKVLSCEGAKIVVQGLNVRKRHHPKNGNQPGTIKEFEAPIHVSNLKLCTDGEIPVKLRMRHDSEGERQLYYKEGGKEILYRPITKAHK